MYNFVGVSALLSIVTIIVLLPLQAIIINKLSKYQTEALVGCIHLITVLLRPFNHTQVIFGLLQTISQKYRRSLL